MQLYMHNVELLFALFIRFFVCLTGNIKFHGAHMALPFSESERLRELLCGAQTPHGKICTF